MNGSCTTSTSGASIRRYRDPQEGRRARPSVRACRCSAARSHIYAQIIDDVARRHAGCAASSREDVEAAARARARSASRRRSASVLAAAREGEGHRRACASIAAATCTTGASRRSPTAPARAAWNSRRTTCEARNGAVAASRIAPSPSSSSASSTSTARQGGQGRPPVLVQRDRGGRRPEGPRGRGPGQGQRSRRRHPQGGRGRQEEHVPRPGHPGQLDPARRRRPLRRGPRAAQAGLAAAPA